MSKIITILFLVFSYSVKAAVIWDFSPEASGVSLYGPGGSDTYNFSWANNYYSQHYDRISFTSSVSLTGLDIYNTCCFNPFIINNDWSPYKTNLIIRDDSNGSPGDILVSKIIQVTGASMYGEGKNTYYAAHTAINDSVVLDANKTYWISFYGGGIPTIGIVGSSIGDNSHKILSIPNPDYPSTFSGYTTVSSDMAFKLYGDVVSVPEPKSYGLMVLGVLLIAASTKRRNSQA